MNKIREVIQQWIKKQKKLTLYFIKFCVFMLLCALIARGIYGYKLPKVQTAGVEKKTINHTIKVDGTTQAESENAIYVEPGIRIAQVYVTQGQQVKEGDKLLTLDVVDLADKIADKQKEAETLQLQISAAQTNMSIAQSLAQKEKERAEEDYQTTITDAENQITNSAESLQKAQEKLQNYATQDAYIAKQKAKDTQLQSYKNAKDQADEKKEDAEKARDKAEDKLNSLKEELQNYKNNSDGVNEDEKKEHIADLEKKIDTQQEAFDTADDEADSKKDDYENAKDDLESYESSLEITLKDTWQQEKEELTDAVNQKTTTYQDTITQQQEQAQKAGRDIEDKDQPQTVDNIIAINQLSLTQLQEDVNRYQALLDANGLVTSQSDGMVQKLPVTIGDMTPETATLILTQNSDTYDFVANITKNEKKYLAVGDTALVTFDAGRKECKDCKIYAIQEGTEPDTYQVHIQVPSKDLSWNQTGTMQVVKQSQTFDTCVPLQSMMADGTQYYCLVLVERTGFMGQEYAVEKRPVVMVDHNDTYAALENFAVAEDEKVVIYTNHTLQTGDTVRINVE